MPGRGPKTPVGAPPAAPEHVALGAGMLAEPLAAPLRNAEFARGQATASG
jgi:hypothetical protein